jgi:N-methylhydantoinase A
MKLFATEDRAGIKKRFDAVHALRYGFSSPTEPAEIVSLHTSVVGTLHKPAPAKLRRSARAVPVRRRKVHFAEKAGFVNTPVYQRSDLPAGFKVKGPALIEEYASTTVVFPGDRLEVGPHGDLIIRIDRR